MSKVSEKISFIQVVFGKGDVTRDLSNVCLPCPNPECDSRVSGKRKYIVKLTTDQSHCWVCGIKTHDSLIPIIRRYKSSFLGEYIEKYMATPRSIRHAETDTNEKTEVQLDFPSDFRLIANASTSDRAAGKARSYLTSRGLSERDIWYFKMGISDVPKFKERVIIPSFDREGEISFYSARATSKFVKGPKYLVPGIERVSVIFNEINLNWSEELTIVEGPFDLAKCDDNATCLQGSEMSEDYLLFWRIVQAKTPVVLALDPDAARKMNKIASLLSSYDVNVRIMDIKGFKDVGEMTKDVFVQRKIAATSWTPVMDLMNRITKMRATPKSSLLKPEVT